MAQADVVTVAVPSNGTSAVGASLSGHLRPQTPVISWQNGVDNARWLRGALPDNPVVGSIVLYNAVRLTEGTVRYTIPNAVVYDAAAQMLERGVPTEVDHLNGRIVALAEQSGGDAPVNRRIVELVKAEEEKPLDERRRWTAEALRVELERAKEI